MAEFSTYFEGVILGLLKNTAYSQPATVYVALFTAVTGLEADSGVTGEVSGGSYARVALTLGTITDGAASNSGAVTFPTASAPWGDVSHFAIVDHLTNVTWGTNVHVLMWSALDTTKAIDTGDTAQFNSGDLDVTVT